MSRAQLEEEIYYYIGREPTEREIEEISNSVGQKGFYRADEVIVDYYGGY